MMSRLGEAELGIKPNGTGDPPDPGKVREALDRLRCGLLADGGNIELQGIDADGSVRLALQGQCRTCPSVEMTVRLVIEPMLKAEVPEIVGLILE
jgi:Fe-S cluster biogenesis protein NfuA